MNKVKVSRKFLAGSMGLFFINGLMVLMTGSILVYLINDYQLRYEQGGLLISIQSLAYLVTNLLSGPLALAVGRKKALIIISLCFAVGFGGIALSPPLWLLYIFLAITGFGWGGSNNLINFLVTEATDGDSGKITLVHTCYSLGAFIGPLLVGLSVNLGLHWRYPVILVVIGALLLIPLILIMPIHEISKGNTNKKQAPDLSFLRQWRYYMFMMMLFIYVGIEIGFSGWLVTYLMSSRTFAEGTAQTFLSMLWVSMIIGRISVSLFGGKMKKAPFLLLEAIGMVLSSALLIISTRPFLLGLSVCLLGLSFSAFYGMVVANASHLVKISSLASGLLFSMGGLGATILPFLAGAFSEKQGIASGLWSLVIAAVVLVILTALNVIDSKRLPVK